MPEDGDSPAIDTTDLDALRIQAIRWLASPVQHELMNSITSVKFFAKRLVDDARLPHDLQDGARLLYAEAERTRSLVTTLLEVARDRPAAFAPVAVDAIIDEALELLAWFRVDVRFERSAEEGLPEAETDRSRLRQLIVVLLVDALRALGERPRGGLVRVGVTRRTEPGVIQVEVAYTRAEGDRHAGDGALLPIGDRAMGDVGGTLRVERDAAAGRLRLELPIAVPSPVQVAMPAPASTHAAATSATVLVCDDEEAIRAVLVRILERDGMRVVVAPDGLGALEIIESSDVDAVLTDQRMVGMSGIDLYERAVAIKPTLAGRFVVMSGEPGSPDLVRFSDETGVTVVAKPFDVQVVAATIRELVRDGQERGEVAVRG
jgi:CheY-like chemotaxis protein